jgi:hypothetical protein
MQRAGFIGRETKLLQTQILGLKAQERRLLTRRNALAPLCILPTEILLDIIDLLSPHIHTNHGDHMDRRRGRGRVGWVGVMGVCTRMRSLVLNTPRLWADVDLNRNEEWTRLCLERSISSPLQISFNEESALHGKECRGCEDDIPEDQVLRFGHSFETSFLRASVIDLHIAVTDQLFRAACDVLRAPCIPHLWSLTYTMDCDYLLDDQFLEDNDVPVLRGATALTHLVLSGIKFLSPILSLPSLVHFELKTYAVHYSQVDLFRFLRLSPLLEHLCINICDSYRLFDQPANVEPIHLPRLLTLSLTADLSYLMPHLSAIPAPKDMLRVFTGGVPYNVNPIAHDATGTSLKEVFVHIWDMLDITQKTPIVDIINTHVPHCSSLKFTHPGTRIHTVAFSCAGSIGVLRSVLDPVRSIRVTGPYWPGLWDWAATDPLHHLASAEIVEVAHMCDERVPASLCAWLLARAGVNRRIRVLDLRNCARQQQPDCVCDDAAKDSLQRMAPELEEAGWAQIVLVEGKALV